MTDRATLLAADGWQLERVLGDVGGGRGPVVIAFGGIHGNEPAGALAIQEVVEEIRERDLPVRGRFVGLAGNRQALARGRRYLARDLNRRWEQETLDALRERPVDECTAEDREQHELVAAVSELLRGEQGTLICVDLHTASGEGPPFCTAAHGPRNRLIASALPIPLILGISDHIQGTMLDYISSKGFSGVSIEGGQHTNPDTIGNHVAALWLLLVAVGIIDERLVEDLQQHGQRLARVGHELPRAVEVLHRHVIKPGDEFVMEPGYRNFQRVDEGELLARDHAGPIHAPASGRILLPLYQGQGEDGFFIAREVPSAWS